MRNAIFPESLSCLIFAHPEHKLKWGWEESPMFALNKSIALISFILVIFIPLICDPECSGNVIENIPAY